MTRHAVILAGKPVDDLQDFVLIGRQAEAWRCRIAKSIRQEEQERYVGVVQPVGKALRRAGLRIENDEHAVQPKTIIHTGSADIDRAEKIGSGEVPGDPDGQDVGCLRRADHKDLETSGRPYRHGTFSPTRTALCWI